ncbi:MAG: WD40/YVTN/BNR-like repeat-containing protein, partial [Saprospiraceae bacterium]
MMKRLSLFITLFFACSVVLQAQYTWQLLSQSPQNGQKQDDIFMLSPQLGYAVNGSGRIFRTTDGGLGFTKLLDQPGTYFRCIGFTDSLHGFAGNIGTNYFPGVTDQTPLYE